jgi:hypothetical protein
VNGERLYLTCCAPYVGCYRIHMIFIISNEDNVIFFLLVHLHPIKRLLLLTVYRSAIYTYSTPKNFQQFFYMQETNILNSLFIHLLYYIVVGQLGRKHLGVSGLCSIMVDVIKLCAFVGLTLILLTWRIW